MAESKDAPDPITAKFDLGEGVMDVSTDPALAQRPFSVLIGGQSWHHVDTDPQGIWIYRR